MEHDSTKRLDDVVQIDAGKIQDHLGELVRGTVEEILSAMLQAEADRLCGAVRYERSPERVDTRAGHYERKLETKAGEVTLKVPKLRRLPFETAIIERYRRREGVEAIEERARYELGLIRQDEVFFQIVPRVEESRRSR